MPQLQIGQELEVIWQSSKNNIDVIAFYFDCAIFIHRQSWKGNFPRVGETDRITITGKGTNNTYYCTRSTTPLMVNDIVKIRWRATNSGNGLVAVCGSDLIFPKIENVNWELT